MTAADWARETRERYRSLPPQAATAESLRELWLGINRRLIDPHLGRVWWRDDWDVLVVLDALRVDLAREVLGEHYAVGARWSPASTSIDWIERHFAPEYREEYRRTAYVTANPFASHDSPDARSADLEARDLGHLDCVYKDSFGDVGGISTTPPEVVTDRAIWAARNVDCERLIVHYMQPHQPFRARPEWDGVYSNLENLATDVNQGGADIWKRCRDGEIDADDLWTAYRTNLRWVWQSVEDLLDNVDGDVVVTADHGNGMGEWGRWSHCSGQLAPQIRRVPVIRTEATDQQTMTGMRPPSQTDGVSTTDQLAALGYMEASK